MYNLPNPNDPVISLILFGAVVLLLLRGMFWIEDLLAARSDQERQTVEETEGQAGAEAYVHPDRY